MQDKPITSSQFGVLVIIYTIGTSILITPAGLAAGAKQSAWLPACLGLGIGLFMIFFLDYLGKQFPKLDFVQMCEQILGKWTGKIIALAFVFFTFIGGATTLSWVVGNFMVTQVFAETPILAINIPFVICVIYGARIGIQAMSRCAEIYLPWIFLLFLFLIIFSFKDFHIKNLLPVFEVEIKPLTRTTLSFMSVSSMPLVVMLMIFPNISNPSSSKKAFLIGHSIGGILLIITTIVTILVFGAGFTAMQSYPSYALAKRITVGQFLSRIEIIMAIIWIITIYYKCTIYFYASVKGLSKILELRNDKFLSIPLGMIMGALSPGIYRDTVYAAKWDVETWIPFAFTMGILLPVFLLAVHMCKNKLKRNPSQ
ncbi:MULTISPECIES: endospore germination permease [unclassified Bacillus (in: firmicutes)]|uniref:GerAB/ArcD/ProY family transporter n=1 Tax=unclassified Bacillus (in: firmicutes) TaxID=185979 RepID=UPI00158761A2|nr:MULTISPECIES: endospore germination permease [unclassified Bacillus (in: firmicutes)]